MGFDLDFLKKERGGEEIPVEEKSEKEGGKFFNRRVLVGIGILVVLSFVWMLLLMTGEEPAPPPQATKPPQAIKPPTPPPNPPPSPTPPPVRPAVQPLVEKEETELERQEKPERGSVVYASGEDLDRDVFVEFYVRKLRESRKGVFQEVERKIRREIPPAPRTFTPPRAVPVVRPEPLPEEPKKIKIYNIVCDESGCVAYTNVGKIVEGDKIESEKVIKITPFEVRTSRRVIRW